MACASRVALMTVVAFGTAAAEKISSYEQGAAFTKCIKTADFMTKTADDDVEIADIDAASGCCPEGFIPGAKHYNSYVGAQIVCGFQGDGKVAMSKSGGQCTYNNCYVYKNGHKCADGTAMKLNGCCGADNKNTNYVADCKMYSKSFSSMHATAAGTSVDYCLSYHKNYKMEGTADKTDDQAGGKLQLDKVYLYTPCGGATGTGTGAPAPSLLPLTAVSFAPSLMPSLMLTQYRGKDSFFGDDTPLPLASGYLIVLGFGAFFSLFTTLLVFLDKKYNHTEHTSEFFNTAGRDVKTGLTASVIVSQWTWAATLLQSSNVAWNYGVSGPFWYASGATIQVLLFGILAIELKRRAPTAHTVCEMVRARWGKGAHLTFIIFCFLANIIVTSMLLLGGAATVNALTGMDINLASFLIPWGVILYTAAGGLKATFLASYFHTAIIFFVLTVCIYTVYVKEYSTNLVYLGLEQTKSYTDTPGGQCDWLFSSGGKTFFEKGTYACGPVKGNAEGSYLTMVSGGGLMFGIINIVGNFGTVFVDQSYWQSAIAARPASAHKGYLLGGIVWFTIPFALATSLGLCALALQLPINSGEAGSGLVPPAVATHLFGKAGSTMMAIMLFMAITSTGSAEGIAVSSLVAYDIYKAYCNPNATGKQILFVSKVVIVVFGGLMGGLSIILHAIGLNLGWVYLFMGICIGSAVFPLWNLLMWGKANAVGAVVGAWLGMILAVITWMVAASVQSGEISIDTLGKNEPMLAGNLVAILSSGAIHALFSLAKPQNYDYKTMGEISMLEDDKRGLDPEDFTEESLNAAARWVKKYGYGFTIIMVVIWPLLSIPAGVFTTDYFAFWVFISLAWGFTASLVIVTLPLYESMGAIKGVVFSMLGMAPPKPAGEEKMQG